MSATKEKTQNKDYWRAYLLDDWNRGWILVPYKDEDTDKKEE